MEELQHTDSSNYKNSCTNMDDTFGIMWQYTHLPSCTGFAVLWPSLLDISSSCMYCHVVTCYPGLVHRASTHSVVYWLQYTEMKGERLGRSYYMNDVTVYTYSLLKEKGVGPGDFEDVFVVAICPLGWSPKC